MTNPVGCNIRNLKSVSISFFFICCFPSRSMFSNILKLFDFAPKSMSVVVIWQQTPIGFWRFEFLLQIFKSVDSSRAEFWRGMTPPPKVKQHFWNFWHILPQMKQGLWKCWNVDPPRNQINIFGNCDIFDLPGTKQKHLKFWPAPTTIISFVLLVLKCWPPTHRKSNTSDNL